MTPAAWQLRVWGARGSFPCPGAGFARYGGHTACVALEGPGPVLVLDAGTGLMPCGQALVAGPAPGTVEVLLSHAHWDHLMGLPFFAPLYADGWRTMVRGPRPDGRSLAEVAGAVLAPPVWPVPLAAGRLHVAELPPGEFEAAGWRVRTHRLNHPGATVGFRLERPGAATVGYLTDCELEGADHDTGPTWRASLIDFLAGVNILVHDTMFTEAELATRRGWGHSSPDRAIRLAAEAGCDELVLFHHDVFKDDAAMDRLTEDARATAARLAPALQVNPAIEGRALVLEKRG